MQRLGIVLVAMGLVLPAAIGAQLSIRRDAGADTLSIYRTGEDEPILTQNARPDFRPYIHPIMAPDGRGVLTEFSPAHNPHQTGLFWGFTQLNGRDYFRHPEGEYWRRVSATVLKPKSSATDLNVRWQTVYDLLDENGQPILRETQTWTMREQGDAYILDLRWKGVAATDVTISESDHGGLFLRMPWRDGINGRVFNSVRRADDRANGQRAIWLDIGMQVEGRDNQAHVAIFDHANNPGYPQPWSVDQELGVGPVRAQLGEWSIAKGETKTIEHQLRVYTGELDDVSLTGAWYSYSGGSTSSQSRLAIEEGRRADFLTPEKAVESMTLQDGFTAQVFASEPMITQPMAFCWDDRGRLWVAVNRDYSTRKDMQPSGESQILILEDTDRDGVADLKKVFLENVKFPSAMAVGLDGLWLGAIPDLLFVPDRDGDDRADEQDIEVRLTGWGNRDMHEILNSFHWGPDGWLYGLQGVFTPSRVGKPAGNSRIYQANAPYPKQFEYADDPTDINGGVWRYHPTKDRFEIVAHGLSNAWGIDYDAKGQIFVSACVIPHLWHIVQGGLYHRQAGSHFNPYAYSDIRTIGDHRHRSAHGGARVYLSDAFPEAYRGRLFMGNIHEHAVLTDILDRKGSGFVGRHGDDFMLANNAQFIGFSTEIGPDGAVYTLDWHDADICGISVRTKDTGRVFRIAPKTSHAKNWEGRYADLQTLRDEYLVNLQLSESAWHARRARVILQNRSLKGSLNSTTHDALQDIFTNNANGDHRLRALWALHVTDGIARKALVNALEDPDEYVRAWAIQLLCEDKNPPKAARKQFAKMAKEDESPVVRLYLASALQRLALEDRWPIANHLVTHEEDAGDHNIPKLLWYGIEPIVADNPDQALKLAGRSRIPTVTQHIARRLTDADELPDLVDRIGRESEIRNLLLLGMRDGLDGRNDAKAPKNWAKVYGELRSSSDESASIALQLSLQFGDAVAARALVETLQDDTNNIADRQRAIRGLAARKREELKPQLVALLDDDLLRTEAIRAVASFDDTALAVTLLERYDTLSLEDKLEVVHALASRPDYGTALMDAIRSGAVPRRDVPTYIARLLLRVVGNRFMEVWGSVEELPDDSEAAFDKFNRVLGGGALANGDPRQGREVFNRHCFACHQLYGEGGNVGPDLTGANRTDVNYLLGNILTPSAVIQDDYKMTMVFTDDGQVYSGVIAGEDDRQLRLRVANVDEPVTISKSQITDREATELSMMPEGLLNHLTDNEVLNLFAYLGTLEPVLMQNAANQ